MTQLETRAFEVRAINKETRTITGVAVPYGVPTQVGEMTEQFKRGVFGDIKDVKLRYGHDDFIGLVTKGEDLEDGYHIEARISATAKGNEVYELLKDGVLNRFSVGFVPVEDEVTEDGTVTRAKAVLKEVSVVPFPAYDGAHILAVRDADSETQNTRKETHNESMEINVKDFASVAEVTELRDAVDEIERRLATDASDEGQEVTQFRSAGEFIKALAANDTAAQNEVRAYTGAVLADSHTSNDWKAEALRIVNKGRPVLNAFNRGPLGASGNTVEYPVVQNLTGAVASQANEGDDLPYLEVVIGTETAPVLTYGGYSRLSRQAIERSDVSYLDAVLRHQAAEYAKTTNAKVRSVLTSATPQSGTSFTLSSATAADFLGAVVDGVAKIDANAKGAQAEFVLVSTDVYLKAATLLDDVNRPIFAINGDGSNTIGNANVRTIAGSIAGLPLVVDPGLSAKTLYVAASEAVTSWESAGAPVRLQDENIINLSKDYSLYGYLAVGVTNALALVKPSVA